MKIIITGICIAFLLTACGSVPTTDKENDIGTTTEVFEQDSLPDKTQLMEELMKMGYSKALAEKIIEDAEKNKVRFDDSGEGIRMDSLPDMVDESE